MAYLVLTPLVYPLFWAVLIGQALFPSKAIITEWIESFFQTPQNGSPKRSSWESVPLLFRFPLIIPVLLNMMSDLIVQYIWKSKKNILYITLCVGFFYLTQDHLLYGTQIMLQIVPTFLNALRQLLATEKLVGTLIFWCISWWFIPTQTTGVFYLFSCSHQATGIFAAVLFMYKICGSYLTFSCLGLVGYGLVCMPKSRDNSKRYIHHMHEMGSKIISSPVMEPFRRTLFRSMSVNSSLISSPEIELGSDDVFAVPNFAPARDPSPPRAEPPVNENPTPRRSLPQPRPAVAVRRSNTSVAKDEQLSIMFVFIIFGLVAIWENTELRLVAVITISAAVAWSITKMMFTAVCVYFKDYLLRFKNNLIIQFKSQEQKSGDMMVCWNAFKAGNVGIANILRAASSNIASFLTITLSLLFLGAFVIFMIIQIYYEAHQCVQLFSEISERLEMYPTIELYTDGVDMDEMVKQGFNRAQNLVVHYVHEHMAESDNQTMHQTEEQIQMLFERFYNLTISTEKHDIETSEKFWDAIMSLDWAYALKMASENIQTIQEYLMLCMKIMLTNLTWAVSTLSDYIYVVFLFVVALFNSLSLSNKGYRPVEALMSCLPTNEHRVQVLITKIQNSVVQVFYATFRLAIFYTVWTCTAHKMIGTTLVSYIIMVEIFEKTICL